MSVEFLLVFSSKKHQKYYELLLKQFALMHANHFLTTRFVAKHNSAFLYSSAFEAESYFEFLDHEKLHKRVGIAKVFCMLKLTNIKDICESPE